ncbi:MAG: hypothetical protein OXH38_12030 [Chloroflexi bacterium]|nr:hypothetical protein [Chloroflexota bacterium]
MVLEDLHELIETLQARIDAHAPALQQSEALTRYALIDPLLRGLGWDTGDPSQVIPEFKSGRGTADYALLGSDGRPDVIIEAKRLRSGLETAVEQVINYCTREGYEFFAVTDGQLWEVYETRRQGDIEEKMVARLKLSDAPANTCLAALALWRPSVIAGIVQSGVTPVVSAESLGRDATPATAKGAVNPNDAGWHELSSFTPAKGTVPSAVRLPDQTTAIAKGWGDFIAEIGRYLYENGHLKESLLPIQRSKNSYIVAESPVNPTGNGFSASRKIGPFYANVNFTSLTLVRDARFMIEQTKQEPAKFAVKLQ